MTSAMAMNGRMLPRRADPTAPPRSVVCNRRGGNGGRRAAHGIQSGFASVRADRRRLGRRGRGHAAEIRARPAARRHRREAGQGRPHQALPRSADQGRHQIRYLFRHRSRAHRHDGGGGREENPRRPLRLPDRLRRRHRDGCGEGDVHPRHRRQADQRLQGAVHGRSMRSFPSSPFPPPAAPAARSRASPSSPTPRVARKC